MIAELNALVYVDREGRLCSRIRSDAGGQLGPGPVHPYQFATLLIDEAYRAVDRARGSDGSKREVTDVAVRRVISHVRAYAWCTCLGWIATLQETARLAYECGLADSPHALETPDEIGAEQVRVAAQNAGLVPEDPDPFAFGDCAPGVDEDGLPCLRELSARYDLDYQADGFAHPPTEPRKGKPLWDWMEAHPVASVESAVAVVDGYVVSCFEWRWNMRWECTGPHVPWHESPPPDMPCVPVRGYWGDV